MPYPPQHMHSLPHCQLPVPSWYMHDSWWTCGALKHIIVTQSPQFPVGLTLGAVHWILCTMGSVQ